ncbi:hydroxysqualene dehydroxylase HpnE [Roseomonas marmotae]|uniref:FAD-dependent oxidoreductase n=1 Tax=Roseomonas marmotae TaxID=2768161 RepID=A0ABS3KI15_9PROT|nr:hydroxysqualene dehydroxylase HpnE [Roseomonas marmotae]MBO1077109.1 FAD-dependent oxidoreductase [Roseomonas marmotae]QTI81365.1 FAD-dependent oxidoreductase [Roseomonas marmotae]
MTRAPRIHVVGAGLAGLSAAVALAARGMRVILSEAAPQAGGRCRSYHDARLGMLIDNGNHLVLSGNSAVGRYLRRIGAEHRLAGPPSAEFPFLDLRDGTRWTLRPNNGVLPWWVLSSRRRVPGTVLRDYAALARLARRHPGKRIDEILPCRGTLWERLLQPVLISVLNTMPEEGSAELAGAVIRESLARGGAASRPLVAVPSLDAAFIEPALDYLRGAGAAIRLGRRLRGLKVAGDRVAALDFADGVELLDAQDRVILALPPWVVAPMVPGLMVPDSFHAIVNAHFRLAPPPGTPPITGLVGGKADWVFAFADRVSVTISAADHLLEHDADALLAALWGEVAVALNLPPEPPPGRIVKERRATFAATPGQDARRPPGRTAFANLALAGDWTATGLPATIEGALRSGETAAALALSGLLAAQNPL